MNYLAFIPRSRPGLAEATRQDLRALDAALADESRREIAETILAFAAALVSERDAVEDHAPLSGNERAALARMGVAGGDAMSDAEFYASAPVRQGLARRARMVEEATPLAEAARRMGVSDSRLRQRIAEGTLVAIPRAHGRGWLIPAFQLTGRGELPHLGRVLSARRRSVSAEALASAFELPDEEFGGRSPRDWLMAGGDPAPVERLVAGL